MPLVRCAGCSLMYVIHGLTEAEFSDFYNDPKYFDSEYAGGAELSYADNKEQMEEKAGHVLGLVKRFISKGSFLDIGCAGGHLLAVARDAFGYRVKGVEVSKEMAEQGRARGLDIFCGTIEQAPQDWSSFDIVYMGDVLEHIPNPGSFIASIRPRMAPNGLMVLELPLTYNLTLSGLVIGFLNILKGRFGYKYFLPAQHRNNFVDKPPYHVLMFSRASIRNFFDKEGFRLRYMKIYEGKPKARFGRTWYGRLKSVAHWLTLHLPQARLGDRMIVIAEKL